MTTIAWSGTNRLMSIGANVCPAGLNCAKLRAVDCFMSGLTESRHPEGESDYDDGRYNMKEVWSGEVAGWWYRISRRTHGVVLGPSLHWPSRNWNQWQVGLLVVDLAFGRLPEGESDS